MNKLTTAALMGLVAVTATASASVSRWDGFGNIGAAFIADVQDIWTLPGAVVNYKDALYAELGGGSYSDSVWGGANFEVGPGVLAVWGNRPVGTGSNLNYSVPSYGNVPFNTNANVPSESVDVIYGWNMSDSTTLALGLNRASYGRQHKRKATGVDWENDYTANDMGLSLGLEQKNVGPLAMLEVGLQYSLIGGLDEYKDSIANTDDKYSVNGSNMNLRVGGDIAGDNGHFGRVELGFNMQGSDAKNEPTVAPAAGSYVENKYSGLGYNIGYAAGKSGEKGMGLVGLMLSGRADGETDVNGSGSGYDHKYEYGMYQLALGFAAEGKAASWLTVRGGLTTNVLHNTSYVNTDNTGGNADVKTYSTTDYGWWYDLYSGQAGTASFGTSLTFGNLTIDGVVNQNLLWNGPYFVTGSSSGLNTEVSATWAY